jgi:hypothetical protein
MAAVDVPDPLDPQAAASATTTPTIAALRVTTTLSTANHRTPQP